MRGGGITTPEASRTGGVQKVETPHLTLPITPPYANLVFSDEVFFKKGTYQGARSRFSHKIQKLVKHRSSCDLLGRGGSELSSSASAVSRCRYLLQ